MCVRAGSAVSAIVGAKAGRKMRSATFRNQRRNQVITWNQKNVSIDHIKQGETNRVKTGSVSPRTARRMTCPRATPTRRRTSTSCLVIAPAPTVHPASRPHGHAPSHAAHLRQMNLRVRRGPVRHLRIHTDRPPELPAGTNGEQGILEELERLS